MVYYIQQAMQFILETVEKDEGWPEITILRHESTAAD